MKGHEELLQNALTSLLAIKATQSVYGPRSGEQKFETEQGHSFLFSTGSMLVLETTQPPSFQWVTERGRWGFPG